MKQGEEDVKIVKEDDNETRNYIFQKNKKTKIGAIIIVVFLILISIAIAASGFEL